MFKFGVVLSCVLAISLVDCARFPANQRKCKYGDDVCFKEVAEEILKRGEKGYPELGLPVFEPLRIEKLDIVQPDGPVTLKLYFKNIDLHGLSDSKLVKVSGFNKITDKARLEVGINFPMLRIQGPYKVDGRIQVLPVQGTGLANMTFTDIKTSLKIIGHLIEKNGKSYLNIDKSKLDFEPGSVNVKFENLFNGNKELTASTNEFFNTNWRDIMKEIKPAISKAVLNIFNSLVNNVFANIPYDEMFIE